MPVKFVPVIVTVVPPAVTPSMGVVAGLVAMAVTVGGVTNVNRSAEVFGVVAATLVTEMSTVPAPSTGETAVICVGETTVKLAAAMEPNLTDTGPMKFVPVMVTVVPPRVVPAVGVTPGTTALVMVGDATKVY